MLLHERGSTCSHELYDARPCSVANSAQNIRSIHKQYPMLLLYCSFRYSRMHLRRIRRFTPRWQGIRAVLLRHRQRSADYSINASITSRLRRSLAEGGKCNSKITVRQITMFKNRRRGKVKPK